jgi:hypothetical protein
VKRREKLMSDVIIYTRQVLPSDGVIQTIGFSLLCINRTIFLATKQFKLRCTCAAFLATKHPYNMGAAFLATTQVKMGTAILTTWAQLS